MGKILVNLVSNAIKFTPRGGKIRISLKQTQNPKYPTQAVIPGGFRQNPKATPVMGTLVVLEVSDTGPGIAPDQQDKIFDRFYQASPQEDGLAGTGIGLEIVKEFAALHQGWVSVISQPGQGSTFSVCIPQFQESEKNPPTHLISDSGGEPTKASASDQAFSPGNEPPAKLKSKHPWVLIVEDNPELRQYLIELLESSFRILSAPDGQLALEQAREHLPDLIISDIMMPVMGGIQLCQQIKSDFLTSHIPVLLLTARRNPDHELEGIRTGADDYITKPFHQHLLIARANNLIENRRKLQQKFQQKWRQSTLEGIPLQKSEKIFLDKVIACIDTNLDNPSFNVEMLSEQMNLSRRQLHRKIKALASVNPTDFINQVKMKKAGELLASGKYSVTEIAYSTGFSDASNFSQSFKKFYGESPSGYLKKTS
ncbi:MAG: response regulator [Bacteroidia bacterium]|nr:response regulator [Bacteroidia bacterium]